jgi:CRP/FNR family transcriptional regulator
MAVRDVYDGVPFLKGLAPADRKALVAASAVRVLSRGDSAFTEQEPARALHFVLRGRVKLTKQAQDGSTIILQTPGPGRLICPLAVCGDEAFCCACVAMEDGTEILVVDREQVLELFEDATGASLSFVREVCACQFGSCQRIEVLASKTIERRIALLLLKLAESTGRELPDGTTRVPVALSRQELASLCGTTLETAIRVMSAFRRASIVRTVARGFVIDDLAALRARSRAER